MAHPPATIPTMTSTRTRRLEELTKRLGVTVHYEPVPILVRYGDTARRLEGFYHRHTHSILIDGTLPATVREAALAHELIHALHGDDGHQAPRIERARDEEAAHLLITPEEYARAERLVDSGDPYRLARELETTIDVIRAWQHSWRAAS